MQYIHYASVPLLLVKPDFPLTSQVPTLLSADAWNLLLKALLHSDAIDASLCPSVPVEIRQTDGF